MYERMTGEKGGVFTFGHTRSIIMNRKGTRTFQTSLSGPGTKTGDTGSWTASGSDSGQGTHLHFPSVPSGVSTSRTVPVQRVTK